MNKRVATISALMLALSIAPASCGGSMATREQGSVGGPDLANVPVVGPGYVMQNNSLTQQQIESQRQQIEQQQRQFQQLQSQQVTD
jgi:membrane protein involved in colicin uptake